MYNKIVIWGIKYKTHTHYWIHHGYYRAMKYLNENTIWIDDKILENDDIIKNSIIFTSGICDKYIPLREDCFYILHNCKKIKYKNLIENNQVLLLQVYTHDVFKKKFELTKHDECIYYSIREKKIYLPWATDLLPNEIEKNKKRLESVYKNRKKQACFIGTVWNNNINEITEYQKLCDSYDIKFIIKGGLSMEDNIRIVQESLLSPTIVGKWQVDNGYIPCRIFKNISYSGCAITNSETVYKLFNKKIIYGKTINEMFHKGLKYYETCNLQDIYATMDFVKNKHTYIQRSKLLLTIISKICTEYSPND